MKIFKFNESQTDNLLDKINDYLTSISDDNDVKVKKIDESFYEIKISFENGSSIMNSINDIRNQILWKKREEEILLKCEEFLSRIDSESFHVEISYPHIFMRLNFSEKTQGDVFLKKDGIYLTIYKNRLRKILMDKFGVDLLHITDRWDDLDEFFSIVFDFTEQFRGDDDADLRKNVVTFLIDRSQDCFESEESDDDDSYIEILVGRGIGSIKII
jgi:hypothetical protein